MDPELIRQRQQFLRKAASTPVIENLHAPAKKIARSDSSASFTSRKSGIVGGGSGSSSALTSTTYKTQGASSQYRFAILHKILSYMKKRHLEGDTHGLTVDEILEETKQFDVSTSIAKWLDADALRHNPKTRVQPSSGGDKFTYRPPHNISTRKDLLRLLDKYDSKGYGGISLDDVLDSLPNADRHVKFLEEKGMIVIVVRPQDKKKVLFYNDRSESIQLTVDEEIQKLWRSCSSGLEGLDDNKIQDYLAKSGHTAAVNTNATNRHMSEQPKRKERKKQYKKLNDHMQDILEDYSHLQQK